MRKLGISLFLLLNYLWASGQGSNFTFAQSPGTYSAITGGTILTSGVFDDANFVVTLPVSFPFIGTNHTQVTVNTNGWISLGSTVPAQNIYFPISNSSAVAGFISALGMNLQNADSGTPEIRWEQVADEIIFQWQDLKRFATANTEKFSFQARLNTASGVIQFVYGNFQNITTNLSSPQVGIRGATNSFPTNIYNRLVNTVVPSNTWATSVDGTANSVLCRLTSTAPAASPAAGQTYTWTPFICPAILCPSNISPANGSSINSNTVTLNWSTVANATSYKLFFGTTSTPALQGTYATTSTTINNLTAATNYFWYVVPVGVNNCSPTGCESTITSFNAGCFVTGCVTNISPANGATLNSGVVTLTWNSIAAATTYEVYLGTTNPPTTLWATLNATSLTVGLDGGTHYWFVRPQPHCSAASFCNTNTTQFTIPPTTNNVCSTATNLPGVLGNNSFAGANFEATNPAFCHYSSNKDIWYKFRAIAATAQVTVQGIVSSPLVTFDPAISVYSGSCSTLVCIGSDDAGSATTLNTVSMNNLTIGNIYYARVSSFSSAASNYIFSLGGTNLGNALPLKLIEFTGRQEGRTVLLKWKTTEEQNTKHIEIQRSIDGTRFETIGIVTTSNTAGEHRYAFIDQDPSKGYAFYRLKLVDIDEHFMYSGQQKILFNVQKQSLVIYPDPVDDQLLVSFPGRNQQVSITIYDLYGRQLLNIQTMNRPSLQVNTGSLPAGRYFIKVSDGETSASSGFIKK